MASAKVTVRLFGQLCEHGRPRKFEINAKTVQEVMRQTADIGVEKNALQNALVFVNDKPLTAKRYRHKLSDGDEIAFLTSAGGG